MPEQRVDSDQVQKGFQINIGLFQNTPKSSASDFAVHRYNDRSRRIGVIPQFFMTSSLRNFLEANLVEGRNDFTSRQHQDTLSPSDGNLHGREQCWHWHVRERFVFIIQFEGFFEIVEGFLNGFALRSNRIVDALGNVPTVVLLDNDIKTHGIHEGNSSIRASKWLFFGESPIAAVFRNCFSGNRMYPIRCNFLSRYKHKLPVQHFTVRNCQCG